MASRYDIAIIGAGLGGLTAGAILARAGRKVLVVERSNSVGGAASSYKVGDLFVEGSLHATSDPHHPRDPKHAPLRRAGVLDAVQWVAAGSLYEVRGGPLNAPFVLPDNFDAARRDLTQRFPEARDGISAVLNEMERIASAAPDDATPPQRDATLAQTLDRAFGDNEAVKTALAANLSYYHDDPAATWWPFFAMAQGDYLRSGACYIHGGSQRLSSALARAIRAAGGEVMLRRTASAITLDGDGRINGLTHTAKDGGDPQTVAAARVIGNAAPEVLAALLPADGGDRLRAAYADRAPSISLFGLTLGLARPPRDFGVTSYSTQLLPEWMTRLADYAAATTLMAHEPGQRMPPLAVVDYAAIKSGIPAPPYVLSVVGPDALSNWDGADPDAYRARRARWQTALVACLDRHYPGLAGAVVASSFNTAVSMRGYLGAPHGAVYGFAPTPPRPDASGTERSPATVIPGLYLASAYAGFGGYTGVIAAAGQCADMILAATGPNGR
jgi:phytoene dehydrogenase-like protein